MREHNQSTWLVPALTYLHSPHWKFRRFAFPFLTLEMKKSNCFTTCVKSRNFFYNSRVCLEILKLTPTSIKEVSKSLFLVGCYAPYSRTTNSFQFFFPFSNLFNEITSLIAISSFKFTIFYFYTNLLKYLLNFST